jgi:hypothetical protein
MIGILCQKLPPTLRDQERTACVTLQQARLIQVAACPMDSVVKARLPPTGQEFASLLSRQLELIRQSRNEVAYGMRLHVGEALEKGKHHSLEPWDRHLLTVAPHRHWGGAV